MIIKSILLNNIRSYKDEKIVFKKDSIILSGDVGSGKSSILMGIEYALFSPINASLSGNAMLRHGTRNGFIELAIEVDKKDIIIRRNLYKKSDKVSQGKGYIIIDDIKYDLSPTQIKGKILEILSYPIEFLKKGYMDIFQFSVYTPQEKIKDIINSDSTTRKEILNSVFDIDKYKIINDGNNMTVSEINRMIKLLKRSKEGIDEDIEEKKNLFETLERFENEKNEKEESISSILESIEKYKKMISKKEELIKDFLLAKENLKNNKRNIERNEDLLDVSERKINENNSYLKNLKKKIKNLGGNIVEIDETKEEITKTIDKTKEKIYKNTSEIGKLEEKITTLDNTYNNGICDICEQDVYDKDSFKKKINKKKENKINKEKENEKYTNDLEVFEEKLEKLNNNETIYEKLNDTYEIINRTKNDTTDEGRKIKEIKKETKNILLENKSLEEIINSNIDLEGEYKSIKKKKENLDEKKNNLDKKITSLKHEIKYTKNEIKNTEKRIKEKQLSNKYLIEIMEIKEWLKNHFSKILEEIEKQSISTILFNFNTYFKEWFQLIIQDNSITVSIDDSFSPIITQNGYETKFSENLSGGEGTSVALAYRLALNQVINEQKEDIKTKNILILDEPTYGISREQLKNVRNVFNNLHVEQLIVVSHEPEMEGFVNNVIHIEKKNNVSRIVV